MTKSTLPATHANNLLVFQGVHLWLTEAMKAAITQKAQRLLRHEPRIIRVRVDVACENRRSVRDFTAKARIEMPGPDLSAAVTHGNAYQAIDLLIDKLDRMLRKRTTSFRRNRATDDIRLHAPTTEGNAA